MVKMKVLVVILNYNAWRDTAECLQSLAESTYKNFEVYIVENSDRDQKKQVMELKKVIKDFPQPITLDIQSKNTGFAGGVNVGISYALKNNFDTAALLNPDATVEKIWLKNLVMTIKKTGADAATGLMLDEKGEKIINTGDIYTRWGVPEQRDENLPVKKASKSGWVFGATGGATLYKTDFFRTVGLFDEKLFAYNEDVDISWRGQLLGQKFYYEQSAIVYHRGGVSSTSAFKTRQVFANLPVVMWKNVPREMLLSVVWRFFLAYIMFFGFKITRGEGWPALKGVFRSWRLLPHSLRERRRIMRQFKNEFTDKSERSKRLE
ncbi:glycosyltransferase family 2 protein, partial [Candidatus Saccharibacteria bacterium]|nr:glycosyltransferase family 2 protein [Candidatus Saccharibacteria bacterium]